MNTTEKDNLSKALAIFIEAFRPYIVSVLLNKYGETWQAEFANTVLLPDQRKNWEEGLRSGSTAVSLLDYPHFKHFAIKYKELIIYQNK